MARMLRGFTIFIILLSGATFLVSCDLPDDPAAAHALVETWWVVTITSPLAVPPGADREDIIFNTDGSGSWISSQRAGGTFIFIQADPDLFTWTESGGTVTLDFDVSSVSYTWVINDTTLTLTNQSSGATEDYTSSE